MLRNAATAVICLLCLAACSQGHGPEAIPQETVERLNTVFAQAARLSRGLAVEAWGVFASPPEPLASESPQAQRYAFFENVAYRKIARDGGVAVWASGATRVTPF
ncbi:fimbrillin family protein [Desulfohalovibrio reitneri]|uniref:fimbrillin family protein n=1 Tax=Desulfohalovibrio reitneri TaxID=1307759 RepID=UPI0004A6B60E|nr:fimbrillin family protein [Desulfohalovibrio reitneri]